MQVKKSVSSLFIREGQKYSAIPYKESIPKTLDSALLCSIPVPLCELFAESRN